MSKKPFEKFIKPELKGSKKKEAIRQQKRKLKEESRLRGEEFRKKEAEKYQAVGTRYGNTPDQRGKAPAAKNTRYDRTSKTTGEEKKSVQGNPHQPAVEMPLNKFIAHAGISGRREAAELVKAGKVTVNGDIVYEPGYKVLGNEDVKVNGKKIFSQKNLVYLLLNKPKDYLTTLKDPEGRKTVMDLIKAATKERVYPVGRLDRNTTGVLLLTNDGELAQKLTHPSYEVKKIYEVKLDKPVAKADMESILNGITLEDGFIKADAISYTDPKDKTVVGIEIHSGRNRIVRRIFEHLGYDVRNLDRVMFANLTKKNVDRSKWRHLNEKEVRLLKFMNQSFIRAKKQKDEAENKAVAEVLGEGKGKNEETPRAKRGNGGKTGKPGEKSENEGKRENRFAGSKRSGGEVALPGKRIKLNKSAGSSNESRSQEATPKQRKRIYKTEERPLPGAAPKRSYGGKKEVKRSSSSPAKRTPGRKRP